MNFPGRFLQLFPEHFLTNCFELAGLTKFATATIECANQFVGSSFLTVDITDTGQKSILFAFNLFEILLAGEKIETSCFRAGEMWAVRPRVAVGDFHNEGNGIANFEIRKRLPVVPSKGLFAFPVF